MARVDQKQFDYYLSLVKGGMKPSEAAKKAYPKGVREPREKAVVDAQKRAEKKGDLATLTGAAGTVGGALATKGVGDAVSGTGWFAPEATATGTTTTGAGATGATGGAGTSGLASTAAENAAWNAGATQASSATTASTAGTGAATGAEAGAGAAGTEGAGAGIGASWAIPALATAYTLNEAYKNYKDSEGKSEEDAAKDSGGGIQGGLTYLIGGPYGYMASVGAGVAGSMFGSKKGKDQQARDKARKVFQEAGFVDENWNVELANGQKFDIGKDGGDPRYHIDFADPETARDLNLVAPLATLLTGGSGKLKDDFSGYFTNAIRSDGDPVQNAKKLYERAGITSWEQGRDALRELQKAGTITEEELAVYDQGLANIFGGVPLANVAPKEPKATPEQVGTGAGKAAVSNALLIGRVPKGVDASQGAASIAGVPRLPATQPIIGQGLVDPEYMTEAEKRQAAMMANQRPIARYGA